VASANNRRNEEAKEIIMPICVTILRGAGLVATWAFTAWGTCPQATQQVENQTSGECYSTVQAAVNAAVSGETLTVYPGRYTENVNITCPPAGDSSSAPCPANIKLRAGAGPTVTFLQPAISSAPTLSVSPSGVRGVTDNSVIGGPGFGFTITGSLFIQENHCRVIGNVIQNGSILSNGDNTIVRDNTILFVNSTAAVGISVSGANATVTHNIVKNVNGTSSAVGIAIGLALGANVSDNLIIGVNGPGFADGIMATGPLIINNNAIRDIDPTSSKGTGIALFGNASVVEIFGNTVDHVSVGINVGSPTPSTVDSFIGYNNFTNTGTAINNSLGSTSLDFSNNYWGCPTGPNSPGCGQSNNVFLYKPFLESPRTAARPE
jgi:hypothetical protein